MGTEQELVVVVVVGQTGSKNSRLTDGEDPVGNGVQDSMSVVERTKYSLEGQTFACCFIRSIVRWAATLEDCDKEPCGAEKSVECH